MNQETISLSRFSAVYTSQTNQVPISVTHLIARIKAQFNVTAKQEYSAVIMQELGLRQDIVINTNRPIHFAKENMQEQLSELFTATGWELCLNVSLNPMYYSLTYRNGDLNKVINELLHNEMIRTFRCCLSGSVVLANVCINNTLKKAQMSSDKFNVITQEKYESNYKIPMIGRMIITSEHIAQPSRLSFDCDPKELLTYHECFDRNGLMSVIPIKEGRVFLKIY